MPGRLDLALGADEPLRHRRLGDQEGARDLLGVEAAERAQRQRHLRLGRQRRVAAGEDQLEPLVGERASPSSSSSTASRHLEQLRLGGERAVAADPVDRAVAGGGDQPGARVRRRAVAGPALGGGRERLLGGLLGEVEVAEEADQGGQDAAPLLAEDPLDQRSTTGRTSTAPPMRAAGIRAASSIAASRSSASNR